MSTSTVNRTTFDEVERSGIMDIDTNPESYQHTGWCLSNFGLRRSCSEGSQERKVGTLRNHPKSKAILCEKCCSRKPKTKL
jgi:hypothetical protein